MPGPQTTETTASWSDVSFPLPLRSHQTRALAAIESSWSAGSQRSWVVLPPGAGKTLVGLEAARRRAQPVVIFSPNTAIQGQWIAEWQRFEPPDLTIGDDRALATPLSSLTYQSLATFDPEFDPDDDVGDASDDGDDPDSLLARLNTGGAALVEAMRATGPLTIILDECHHLLEVWGRLIAELLEELPQATVIALTATPPDSLTPTESELVDALFGPPLYATSIPALVRDGYLAPFAEFAWLVRPSAQESEWLIGEAERFAVLQTDLTETGIASTDFLEWIDRRFVSRTIDTGDDPVDHPGADRLDVDRLELDWYRLEQDEPELAAAALRFCTAGLLAVPPGATLREEHRRPPSADDWVALIKDYVETCLRPSSDERDQELLERIGAALPGIGYQLTRRGIRRGRSPVDRVIARSAAKTDASVEILAAESAELGDRLRAVALCDHERATATVPAGLRGVLRAEAGSARLLLDTLINDDRTGGLSPLMITGRTVAGATDTIAALSSFAHDQDPGLRLETVPVDDHDFVELRGWTSRQWVPIATRFFETGRSRVLIGTRALLGEGWDAQRVNVLVDLTTATTPTAVVQTRGRALRLDPHWPDKVAHTWSVVCVSDDHPGGAGDWDRFVRKHRGYLAVTDSGEIAVGVGHVDPGFSPYAAPPTGTFAANNAAMLVRAQNRCRIRDLWQIGSPYHDQLVHAVRLTSDRRTIARPELPSAALVAPELVPGDPAPRRDRGNTIMIIGGSAAVLITMIVLLLFGQDWAPALVIPMLAGGGWWLRQRRAADLAAGRRLAAWAEPPDLIDLGRAVADGLHAAGLSDRGAEAVSAAVDSGGGYRITLADVSTRTSEIFAEAMAELVAPIGSPRYLLPRYQPVPIADDAQQLRRAGARWSSGQPLDRQRVTYHAVPAVFGVNADRAGHLRTGWNRWVSAGEPIRAATAEGTGILVSTRGSSPIDVAAALRQVWE
ncbi:DEAD/DEAH box helicase family protein [Microlunatus soli]|uniref:Helicase conserved C-terminal domain-containing protein n=1 Tax=Microlunatus soli TaxID=630515 RepID=A0A1H2AAW8_9ACTN|nr:DEAD/DEAH box helicase family protein [Microlunatus soli]SDT43009.1 Helicase conserved C-terminal domain-containing protein [Microlunatus soli]